MGRYLIGLDEGTTGCKACIFDFEGNVVGSDYREYPCYYPKPGWVEQNGDEITEGLFATVKAAIANAGVDPKEIMAMAISSQGCVWGPLDKNGKLLRPFMSWQDLRGASYVEKIKEMMDEKEFYQITGYSLGAVFTVTKYLWYKDNEPELFDKTEMFSLHQDYFLKEFGAEEYWVDTASGSRTAVFDIDNRDWSGKILNLFGLDVNKFPKVGEAGKVVGTVSKAISEKTGLAVGTPLCIGAMDQNCSTLGGGLVKDGDAVVVMGTCGSTTVCSDKPVRDPNGILWVKNNTGPENFTTECNSLASAASYRWYRDVFADLERAAAITAKVDPYELINTQVDAVAPGAAGLTFLPLLAGAAGGRNNPYARGCFLGATLGTTKEQFARAVMEGITLEIRDNLEAQKKAGVNLEVINLTGGGVKSRMWNQMQADIYQVPVRVLQTTETGCLGAAIYAGVGTGVYKSYQEAVDVAVHIKETYEPNPKNFAAYDDAYARWCKAYDSLDKGGYFEMVGK